jgi:hypothetical protein
MYYDASNMDVPDGGGLAEANSNRIRPAGPGGESRSEAHLRSSSFDTDSLTQQVERLRRELIEKTRR